MKSTTGRQEAISAVINYKPLVNAIDLEERHPALSMEQTSSTTQ